MRILLVDDHEMTLEGYVSILKQPSYEFYRFSTCEQVYNWLQKGNIPDVAIIDYNIPAFTEQNLQNGSDCASLIHKYAPYCKNILITAHDEAVTLYQIYYKTKLSGFIVKTDFTSEVLKNLVRRKIPEPYLSNRVKEALNEIRIKESLLSSINMEILMYLSQGFKVSQMNDFLNLSTVAIQKRLNKMLQDFQVKDYHELLQLCKKQHLF